MPITVQDAVTLRNIPKSLCDLFGGIHTRDEGCIVAVELSDDNPNVAKLIKLEKRRGLRE